MVKLISLIHRKQGLDLKEFSRHWRTTHREHALKLVPSGIMRGYVQNHRQEVGLLGLPIAGDGAPEVWMDDIGALGRLRTSPEYLSGAAPDEPNFMSGPSRLLIATSHDGRDSLSRRSVLGSIKLMLFFNPPPDVDGGILIDRWFESDCLTFSRRKVGPLRTELNLAPPNLPESLCSYFRVVECSWWPSMASLRDSWGAGDSDLSPFAADRPSISGFIAVETLGLWPHARPDAAAGS